MKTVRYIEIADQILDLINNGAFKEGDRIPSIRQLAVEMKVSVNTVKEAYWKLEDQRYIVAVPQSGFYVNKHAPEYSNSAELNLCRLDPQKVSLCSIYGLFQNLGKVTPEINLGIAAGLNTEYWPVDKMVRYYQESLREETDRVFDYMMPPGYLPLREQIARQGIYSNLNLNPDEIIITNGCQEALFLALMNLCNSGDTVVIESPTYFNLLQLLERLNLNVVEVPSSDNEGFNLDTLRFVLENHPVKAVFTISNYNNPLGFSMPSWKKKKLVELLENYQVPLLEDDIYGDIGHHERPDTCKSYDNTGNVLLCSSYSKSIGPGLRTGWIAPGKHFDSILRLKTLLNISSSSLDQIAIARFMEKGGFERYLRKLRLITRDNVAKMRDCILEHFPEGTCVSEPEGGFLLWVELPETADVDEVYFEALRNQMLIAPGSLFSAKENYINCMRLNAGIWNDRIARAIKLLGEICWKYV